MRFFSCEFLFCRKSGDVYICNSYGGVQSTFLRRAGDKTKSLIDHKKAYLQGKLIETSVTDFLHGNFGFRAGLGERYFVSQITCLSLSTFETSAKTGRLATPSVDRNLKPSLISMLRGFFAFQSDACVE